MNIQVPRLSFFPVLPTLSWERGTLATANSVVPLPSGCQSTYVSGGGSSGSGGPRNVRAIPTSNRLGKVVWNVSNASQSPVDFLRAVKSHQPRVQVINFDVTGFEVLIGRDPTIREGVKHLAINGNQAAAILPLRARIAEGRDWEYLLSYAQELAATINKSGRLKGKRLASAREALWSISLVALGGAKRKQVFDLMIALASAVYKGADFKEVYRRRNKSKSQEMNPEEGIPVSSRDGGKEILARDVGHLQGIFYSAGKMWKFDPDE